MMRAGWIALLAAAIAAATWAGGWSAVPLVAFLWGAWRREHSLAPLVAGIAGVVAWGGLLAISALRAPVLAVADRVGGLAGVPGAVIVLVMLLFAFGLGWSAAEVGRFLMQTALRGRVTD
jgi:hypothetical protein